MIAAERLSLLLKNSGTYAEYLSMKAAVAANPVHSEMILNYKKLRADAEAWGGQPSLENECVISAAYFQMLNVEPLRLFLEAERKIVELVCGVLETVAESLPPEVLAVDR